jgi:glycogen debranching enzyme
VATIDPTSDKFEATRYWRGPIWINTNWLIAEGFKDYGYDDIAAQIRTDSLELIERFGYCEYFTPDGVRGCGADQFSWSAALTLYWLAE